MLTRSACFISDLRSRLRRPIVPSSVALLFLIISGGSHITLAKAPPLATTVLETEALAAPDYTAAPIAVIPAGVEVELTGEAAPGFLGVYYDGQVAFVPAQYLSLGVRPGI
ncbi:MAG: SH3 domain-containing protein, partial [Thermomicrobiales bacterium]